MSEYPAVAPTSRVYNAGNWPVKSFNAQDGVEVRIIYGSRRFNHSLKVTYENIPDATAELFLQHYFEQQGTYLTFAINTPAIRAGWEGSTDFFNAGVRTQYRYAGPPQMTSVYPGVSTMQVELVASLLPETA